MITVIVRRKRRRRQRRRPRGTLWLAQVPKPPPLIFVRFFSLKSIPWVGDNVNKVLRNIITTFEVGEGNSYNSEEPYTSKIVGQKACAFQRQGTPIPPYTICSWYMSDIFWHLLVSYYQVMAAVMTKRAYVVTRSIMLRASSTGIFSQSKQTMDRERRRRLVTIALKLCVLAHYLPRKCLWTRSWLRRRKTESIYSRLGRKLSLEDSYGWTETSTTICWGV